MGLLATLLGRAPAGPTDEERADAQRSVVQLEAGGLPVAAERRLEAVRAAGTGAFTSALSVNEWALLEREGIRPLTQVMGSSMFKPGWRNLPGGWGGRGTGGWMGAGSGWIDEMPSLSDPFNGARERALGRLEREATLAGADAVVGVGIAFDSHAWLDADAVELTATGTAVRLPEPLRPARTTGPLLSDLSGQDFWLLAGAGLRPAGIVGVTTVVYVASSRAQNQVLNSGNSWWSVAGRANQELPEFTQGTYTARELALEALNDQAGRLRADGIVGVTFAEDVQEREWEASENDRRNDLIVRIDVLGTAITGGHAPVRPSETLTILPLR